VPEKVSGTFSSAVWPALAPRFAPAEMVPDTFFAGLAAPSDRAAQSLGEESVLSIATEFIAKAAGLVQQLLETQAGAIEAAAEICADSIANDGWVHLFGCGHSRMMAEEMFPASLPVASTHRRTCPSATPP